MTFLPLALLPRTSELGRYGEPELARDAPHQGSFQTVLLATDLTPVSDDATRQAIALAGTLGARLIIVNVIDEGQAAVGRRTRIDQLRSEREPAMLKVVEEARSRGVEATYLLWTGEPGRSIVAAAASENADLIVVGTRGLDRAGRFLLGSVSDHVVYKAGCPVLVAR